jgi:hypothetical protein
VAGEVCADGGHEIVACAEDYDGEAVGGEGPGCERDHVRDLGGGCAGYGGWERNWIGSRN